MLSDRQIKNLVATGNPYRMRDKSTDQSTRGFGVQVSAAGAKTFYVEYSFGGQRGHFYRLGAYPGLSLAQARERCREVRNLVDQGIDPKAELERRRMSEVVERKAQEQQALQARTTATYDDLVRVYLESLDNATTRSEIDRLLQKDAYPILKGKRVTEIEPSDIRIVLASARKRGAQRVVFMLHSYLHAAFVYAIGEQEINGLLFPLTTNPVAAVKKPDSGMTPGSRVLSKEEIVTVWQALAMDADRMSPMTIGAIRLMLLSGQRLQEILRTRWDQLDFADATWSFAREQTKTKRPHLLPLTPMIREALIAIPQLGPLVFPHSRQPPMRLKPSCPFARSLRPLSVSVRGMPWHPSHPGICDGPAQRIGHASASSRVCVSCCRTGRSTILRKPITTSMTVSPKSGRHWSSGSRSCGRSWHHGQWSARSGQYRRLCRNPHHERTQRSVSANRRLDASGRVAAHPPLPPEASAAETAEAASGPRPTPVHRVHFW
jgi:integrase